MIVGVDIGGTKTAVAGFSVAPSGELVRDGQVVTVPTPATEGPRAVVDAVLAAIREAVDVRAIRAVGVGTAGVVSPGGSIASATDAIAGWAGFPLRAELEHTLGIPVVVVNDVHAGVVAEARIGAGALASSTLMVAVGTGIGGAVAIGGEVRTGDTGTAGSVGHLAVPLRPELAERCCPCGGQGHIEAVASGPGMELTYVQETGEVRSLREIADSARIGDAAAARVIAEGAHLLGAALASANAIIDAELILLGGGVTQIGPMYVDEVAQAYAASALPGPAGARIAVAQLGIDATMTGAAILAAASD